MGSAARNPRGDLEANAGERPLDKCFWCVIIAGIAYVSLILVLTLIMYYADDPEISVSAFNVSSFHLSPPNNTLSSDFVVFFAIKNPNSKARLASDQISASVLYDDDSVAQGLFRPLDLAPKNVSHLTVIFSADRMTVGDNVADGIRSDLSSGDGTVKFRVSVVSHVVKTKKYRGWEPDPIHELRVSCKGIGVRFDNATAGTGSMTGPVRKCDVGLYLVQES